MANYGSDSLTVIDRASAKVVATLPVGERPQAVAADSKTHRVYVANTHGDSVSVIDGANARVVATVKTGKGPYAIAVDREMNQAYVATMAGTVTVINGNTLSGTLITPPAVRQ